MSKIWQEKVVNKNICHRFNIVTNFGTKQNDRQNLALPKFWQQNLAINQLGYDVEAMYIDRLKRAIVLSRRCGYSLHVNILEMIWHLTEDDM
jgi:hypothetical protein